MKQPTPWIIALMVSVLVNGAMIGFVLHRTSDGPNWRFRHHEAANMMPPGSERVTRTAGFNVRAFIHNLPPEARENAERRIRDELRGARSLFEEAREARQNADAVMRADPFDPDAAAVALSRVRETRTQYEAMLERVIIDVLEDLDPEDRAQALSAGRRGPPPGSDHRRSRWRDHERGRGDRDPHSQNHIVDDG